MSKNDILSLQKRLNEIDAEVKKGCIEKRILPFPRWVFDALRTICYSSPPDSGVPYNGLPLSILLFTPDICNGYCFEMSKLLTLAFDDCTMMHGDNELFRLKAKMNGKSANHAFVEANGNVFDTTLGLMFDKFTET